MQDFLEMFPSTPAQPPAPNPLTILPQSEAEGPGHCNEEISNETDHAQPQSEPSRGAKALETAKGAYIGAPTIEEVSQISSC